MLVESLGGCGELKVWFVYGKTIYIIITVFLICTVLLMLGKSVFHFNVNSFTDPQSNIIVIDPGHGGVDGGATVAGVMEKDINLGIALKLQDCLIQKGYNVILTRDRDIELEKFSKESKGKRHIQDLNARVKIINESNAQLFVSVHVNCNIKNPQANSAVVYYNDRYSQNKVLANSIQDTLNSISFEGFKRTPHAPYKHDYYLLKQAKVPGVIIEAAFLSNKADRELLMKEGFRDAIAGGIVQGIERYLAQSKSVLHY